MAKQVHYSSTSWISFATTNNESENLQWWVDWPLSAAWSCRVEQSACVRRPSLSTSAYGCLHMFPTSSKFRIRDFLGGALKISSDILLIRLLKFLTFYRDTVVPEQIESDNVVFRQSHFSVEVECEHLDWCGILACDFAVPFYLHGVLVLKLMS